MSLTYDQLAERLAQHQGDWLRKALEVGGVTATEMATYLELSRRTMTNYLSGRTSPKNRDLKAWALRCGVPLQYLETGVLPSDPDDGLPSDLAEKLRSGN